MPAEVKVIWYRTVVHQPRAYGVFTDAPSIGQKDKIFENYVDSFPFLMA